MVFGLFDVLAIGLDAMPQPVDPLEKRRLQTHFFDAVRNPLTVSKSFSVSTNEQPDRHPLTYTKRYKPDGMILGEGGGYGAVFVPLSSKNFIENRAMCGWTLSACTTNLGSLSGHQMHATRITARMFR
jgi:hypothetical protein